jgi:asparagine N-glycosylation enzyme membrane subunit Stt3
MAVTWKILKMFRSPTYNGASDVIRTITYEAHLQKTVTVDETDNIASFTKNGEVTLDVSDVSNLTPYADVTEANAKQWLFNALGSKKQEIETELEMQVEFSLSPTSVSGLPWYTPEAAVEEEGE